LDKSCVSAGSFVVFCLGQNRLHRNGFGFYMILFFISRCERSKKLAPEVILYTFNFGVSFDGKDYAYADFLVYLFLQYEKAASILSSHDPPVVLAKIDADGEKNKDLATEFEARTYPTIRILRNGGKNVQEYKGPREADGIAEYLKKQSGPASAEIKSVDDATAFIGENKVVIVSDQSFHVFALF